MPPINLDPIALDDGYPPVEKWHPEFCGKMDMVIKANGEWVHEGQVIKRDKMMTLFSRILWREGEDYFLVTPSEKVQIEVEDAPFQVVRYEESIDEQGHPVWCFYTKTNDALTLGVDAEVALFEYDDALLPYVSVRHGMWASFHRNVFYQLVEQASVVNDGDTQLVQLTSAGKAYTIGIFHEM
ncbi:DUF1285 domain-containing protein [Marinomonas atlantica]|uniref:DUF1285 domain-containing protein n=1 Tax=Marinomonas atlantica TaxID=1806668 RepID=UPI0008369497|nr:DUF1285 domain-containing protein [Marinomonas atlantica]MCO4785978.1 DUF1285 domain-containing protein [Marinomonas atlantica]